MNYKNFIGDCINERDGLASIPLKLVGKKDSNP